jgi:hypothetical protein
MKKVVIIRPVVKVETASDLRPTSFT